MKNFKKFTAFVLALCMLFSLSISAFAAEKTPTGYEDDPSGGCIRFLTETECERLMGLPEGWTKYGADGREICSTNRYATLGNAIALPCAEYIMAGIAEVMG